MQWPKTLGIDPIMGEPSLAPFAEKTCTFQHGNVLRHRRLRNSKAFPQIGRCHFRTRQTFENRPSGWIGQHFEDFDIAHAYT